MACVVTNRISWNYSVYLILYVRNKDCSINFDFLFLVASSEGAVQKEIDGILSTNNIWSRVFFVPLGTKYR
jgi:hypothetical protein